MLSMLLQSTLQCRSSCTWPSMERSFSVDFFFDVSRPKEKKPSEWVRERVRLENEISD